MYIFASRVHFCGKKISGNFNFGGLLFCKSWKKKNAKIAKLETRRINWVSYGISVKKSVISRIDQQLKFDQFTATMF